MLLDSVLYAADKDLTMLGVCSLSSSVWSVL